MSKSIYEQALKIINRNTFELGLEFGKGLQGLHGLSPDERTKIEQALKQAQKQEKLLELYKEFFRLSNIPRTAISIYVFNSLLEIKNKIKELENK